MSTYRELFDLIEKGVFQAQVRNVHEMVRYVRANSRFKSLDKSEIDRLMHEVTTQYKSEKE